MDPGGPVVSSAIASLPLSTHQLAPVAVDAKSISNTNEQASLATDKTIVRSVANNDNEDDVQILFSVPRRKKKKGKRMDSQQTIRGPPNPETGPLQYKILAHSDARGQDLTMTDHPVPLHRTNEDSVPPKAAPLSSSEGSRTTADHRSQLLSWRPSFNTNHGLEYPPYFSPSTSWYEPSPARLHSNTPLSDGWKAAQYGGLAGNKRRIHGDWEMPPSQRLHHRQSMQISPRTIPVPSFIPSSSSSSSSSCSAYGVGLHPHDWYGRGNNNLSPPAPLESFDWSSFNDANTESFISQSLQQAASTTETPKTSGQDSNGCSHRQYQGGTENSQGNTTRAWPSNGHQLNTNNRSLEHFTEGNICTESRPTYNGQEAVTQVLPSSRPTSTPMNSEPNVAQLDKPHAPQNKLPAPIEVIENGANKNSTPHLGSPTTRPCDILRKPSLYKIPPWQASSNGCKLKNIIVTAQTSPALRRDPGNILGTTVKNALETMSYLPRPQSPTMKATGSENLRGTVLSQTDESTVSGDREFQIPRARAGRKNSPNLIIDIAETCQELFPFATVAERHKLPLKKVFDTFSAIIQLPLLRHADDRRRHGSLGKRRVREYREAKKAMERAQEADRKAQIKAMRANVEEAAKKGGDRPLA